jgi:virginiamycin B lyase
MDYDRAVYLREHQKGEGTMSRLSGLLTVALFAFVVPALHSQAPAGGRGQAITFPDGAGKEIVQAECAKCHGLNQITNSAGYTSQKWQELFSTMVKLPDPQAATVSRYLATHFPPKPGREPVLVSGPVTVSFKEWMVPTLGQRSRDPVQTADGMIWWAGQYGNIVGRLDPRTGDMKEYTLPPGTRPHSITADRAGTIWFMGNANGTVGKLNPANGEVTVYKMPDPAARDPHTPIFDRKGTLWFTVQNGNMVGRLNPATGDIKLVTMPTPDADPYGIEIDSQGVPWVAYNGSHKVASLDPVTMAVREYPLPDQKSRARRVAITSDDMVWIADAGLGRLARLNPKTGEFKSWQSPSGADTQPYGITVVNDIVWYNESRRRPDALVRFDPKTERFQSWAIPSGVGTIRNLRPTADGNNLLIHQTSTNRIGVVTIGRTGTN